MYSAEYQLPVARTCKMQMFSNSLIKLETQTVFNVMGCSFFLLWTGFMIVSQMHGEVAG